MATLLRAVRGNEQSSAELLTPSAELLHNSSTSKLEIFSMLAIAIATVVFTVVALQLLTAVYSRRWQLLDVLIGTSKYNILPPSFEAEPIGMMTVQPDVYEGGDSDSSDDEHGHDHGHDHGPRDITVVGQRWALVTGASRGIGRSFVALLADHGFSLICVDMDDETLDEVVSQTQKRLETGWRGGVWLKTTEMPTVVRIGCDVSNVDAAVARCAFAVAEIPPNSLRMLVNNVGISTDMPSLLAQHTAAEVDRLVRVNMLFGMQLTRALWAPLSKGCEPAGRRSGVVFVSSRAALVPAAFVSVYSATKAALNAFARALRAEVGGTGLRIDVLSLTPGYVRSGNSSRWLGSGSALSEPEEVARAALLLLCTARTATMTPSMTEALEQAAVAHLLPDGVLARLVFERHASQRERNHVKVE